MTYKDSVLVCAASVILWHRKSKDLAREEGKRDPGRRTKDKNIEYPILKYWNLESKKQYSMAED